MDKNIFSEFIRYVVVGGIAFLVDFFILYVCMNLYARNEKDLYVFTTISFIIGFFVNYILSYLFVFPQKRYGMQLKNCKNLFVFAGIAIIGLAYTNIGMYFGIEILNIHYTIAKILVSGFVLIWNYGARRAFLLKKGVHI
jgi:putative flippase GtrA